MCVCVCVCVQKSRYLPLSFYTSVFFTPATTTATSAVLSTHPPFHRLPPLRLPFQAPFISPSLNSPSCDASWVAGLPFSLLSISVFLSTVASCVCRLWLGGKCCCLGLVLLILRSHVGTCVHACIRLIWYRCQGEREGEGKGRGRGEEVEEEEEEEEESLARSCVYCWHFESEGRRWSEI